MQSFLSFESLAKLVVDDLLTRGPLQNYPILSTSVVAVILLAVVIGYFCCHCKGGNFNQTVAFQTTLAVEGVLCFHMHHNH